MPVIRRRLLAVMFTDIVGYSAMVNRDERAARTQLEYQRKVVRRHVARYQGRVIEIIGDGFLVTFTNARAAIECAIAMQTVFVERNAAAGSAPLRLRIGIHVGDIERGAGRLFGDGVNVAARLEPLAPPGGLCVSAQALAQIHGPLRECFVSQGPRTLKNIAEPYEVWALEESGLGAAAVHLPAVHPVRSLLQRYGRATAALALALAAVGTAIVLKERGVLDPPADASIAVLPLENLSHDQDSEDFVAGLHDSLLTEISATPQLKVISRTSVMRYAVNPPPVPQIAQQLNVSYVLEGSVQRQQQRVRINVQLIRARSDRHIWAKTFDRDAADLFEVQTQIAREIARSTQGQVVIDALPVAKRPTDSVEAYDLYLRAIALEDNDPNIGRELPERQIALLERATTLDAGFALAHAALARYNIWAINAAQYVQPERVTDLLAAADRSAARAIALAPHQAESLVAAGLVAFWKAEPLETVAKDFEEALASRPGDSLALFWLGVVYDRMGQLEKSTATLQALQKLDPYNERVYTQIAQSQLNLRRYDALKKTYAQWRAISAKPEFVDFWASQLAIFRSGNLQPRRDFLAHPPATGVLASDLKYARYELALYEHRFADAAAVDRAEADTFVETHTENYDAAANVGTALALAGDAKAAARYLVPVAQRVTQLLREHPDDPTLLMSLESAEMLLDREDDAIAHGRRAVELTAPKPGRKPGHIYFTARLSLAQTLAHFGHKQEALDDLAWLLNAPSDVHAHAVLLDPLWTPLNQDPDFTHLVRTFLPA